MVRGGVGASAADRGERGAGGVHGGAAAEAAAAAAAKQQRGGVREGLLLPLLLPLLPLPKMAKAKAAAIPLGTRRREERPWGRQTVPGLLRGRNGAGVGRRGQWHRARPGPPTLPSPPSVAAAFSPQSAV